VIEMKPSFDLKEYFPLHFRIALLATLVLFILAFQLIPEREVKPYKPKVHKAIKVEKLPPQLKNIVEPPPPPKPKIPVAAKTDEEVEQQTIEKTDFTGFEREAEVDLEVPDFVPYDTPPQALNEAEARRMYLEYPEICRKAGIEGTVYLKLLVWKTGEVKKVVVLKSLHEACDAAAVKFAYHLRFSPAKQRDIAVSVWVAFPVKFVLTEE